MIGEVRVVTVVATIRTTADDERIRAAFKAAIEVPLEEYDTALIPCGWAPDPSTIADYVRVGSGAAVVQVDVIDLNPGLPDE